ncbi:MAG: hypothetical protein AAFV07_15995, partial [Bacteroidota bacterium]
AYTAYADREDGDHAAWRMHFGVIRIKVTEMELLRLGREGHLRARFAYAGVYPAGQANWLVP